MQTNKIKRGIYKTKEDGTVIFKIIGFENDIKGYKRAYSFLMQELSRHSNKIRTSGKPYPVIRTLHSMEIH